MDPNTLDLLTKGGFAALFIWLFFDTRKEAREREARMSEALEKANQDLGLHTENSAKALQSVADATQSLAEALQKMPCVARDSGVQKAVAGLPSTVRKESA